MATSGRLWLRQVAPGIAFALVLALCAQLIADGVSTWTSGGKVMVLSPVLCAVLLGAIWRNGFGLPRQLDQGLQWVMHVLLKAGIALVGLRLTLTGAGEIAVTAAPVVVGCIGIALASGALMARLFEVPRRLALLLCVGTAVCGCTAVVALAPVIRARHEETGFAIVCVVAFGCIGMLLYPWLASYLFGASSTHVGVFLGTAIHDTSQVVGAALIYSQQHAAPDVLSAASVTKLLRNLSIAVLIPAAAWLAREPAALGATAQRSSFAVPLFVVGFMLLIVLRTAGDAVFADSTASFYWHELIGAGQLVSELLLICGMTAVGLSVSFAQVRGIGPKPFAAGLSIAVIVCASSIGLTLLVRHLQL
ncbi:MAG: YeiH family protein [Steroidobacteraceae bacterium]